MRKTISDAITGVSGKKIEDPKVWLTSTSKTVGRQDERTARSSNRASNAFGAVFFSCLLLAGCSPKEAPAEDPTVTVQVGAAEDQTIQRKIIAEATLYPHDQAAIVPKIPSPVKKFFVDRGSKVHAGQILGELENQDLLGSRAESQGGYLQAEANYQMTQQKVEQDMRLAKQQLDAQQKLYNSREALFKEGAIAAKDVEDANVGLTQAKNAYELAQKQSDLKVAEAQLNAAKGKNASADAQLNYAKIISPIDGVVTDRPFFAGETAPAGLPVITVMDLSQVVARAHVSQQEATFVKVGDPATISVPGQSPDVKGKVSLVSPALDQTSTTVEVWVQAPNPGTRLKPGSSVKVTIVGQTVPHAIVAPVAALLTATDGVVSVIALDTDNKPKKKRVKIGIRDGGDVQILEGLTAGERVVTIGAFELDKMDADVLAKAKIQVQAPKMPEEDEDQ